MDYPKCIVSNQKEEYICIQRIKHTGQHVKFWFYHIWYAQKPPMNAHVGVPSRVTSLNYGASFQLHPSFVYASSEGSGESTHMCRLTWVFVTWQCNSYPYLMSWYICYCWHWRSSHYAVTHVRNKNSNIQGRSPNVVSVIFHAIRKQILSFKRRSHFEKGQLKRITAWFSSLPLMCVTFSVL